MLNRRVWGGFRVVQFTILILAVWTLTSVVFFGALGFANRSSRHARSGRHNKVTAADT